MSTAFHESQKKKKNRRTANYAASGSRRILLNPARWEQVCLSPTSKGARSSSGRQGAPSPACSCCGSGDCIPPRVLLHSVHCTRGRSGRLVSRIRRPENTRGNHQAPGAGTEARRNAKRAVPCEQCSAPPKGVHSCFQIRDCVLTKFLGEEAVELRTH